MSDTRLRVCWSRYGLPWQEQRDRIMAYAQGIRGLHPLLSDFSWKGVGGSYKKMLTYPNVWDMPDEQWLKTFDFEEDCDSFSHEFWNRRTQQGESFLHYVSSNKIADRTRPLSLMVAGDIPDAVLTEGLLTNWLEIAITAFDAEIGEIATFEELLVDDQPVLFTPLWRAWLKQGASLHDVGFLKPIQTQPPSHEQPLLGGTLYTWPEFAPWDLLHQRSTLTRG